MLMCDVDFEVQSGVVENTVQCAGVQGSEIDTGDLLITGELEIIAFEVDC